MAESLSKLAKHQKNVESLMDRLKELTMEAETEDGAHLFSRVEGIYLCEFTNIL